MKKVQIGVIHPQPMLLLAIETMFGSDQTDFEVIGTYSSCNDFKEALLHGVEFDVLIAAFKDYGTALNSLREFHDKHPRCQIIGFSDTLTINQKQRLYQVGVDGYLSNFCTPDELLHCLHAVMEVAPPKLLDNLTERELDVVRLSVQGLSTVDIAHRLFVSNRTVQNHKFHIYKKTGVHSMEELRQQFDEINYKH